MWGPVTRNETPVKAFQILNLFNQKQMLILSILKKGQNSSMKKHKDGVVAAIVVLATIAAIVASLLLALQPLRPKVTIGLEAYQEAL
jgi:hypothetical protein